MNSSVRPLKIRERELLEKLLEPEFPGRDELRRQLDSVTAKEILEDGTLALQCRPCLPAPVKRSMPTEGECPDADGVTIHVLLHVKDGFMSELEILKFGSSKILNPPTARGLVVWPPCDS